MKITGRNIKRRLYRLAILPKELKRARYFRGHGVHSPFVYRLVREVFMKRDFLGESRELYNQLCSCGVAKRRGVELQNLIHHCSYHSFKIDAPLEQLSGCDILFLTLHTPASHLAEYAARAQAEGFTLCLLSPAFDRERDMACRALVESHPCTSVDNRAYLLLFNNYLPRQKFRL